MSNPSDFESTEERDAVGDGLPSSQSSTPPSLSDKETDAPDEGVVMPGLRRAAIRAGLLLAVLAFGGIVFALLKAMKSEPQRTTPQTQGQSVRVRRVTLSDHTEIVGGYGQVKPSRRALVSAEVAGRVAFVHEELREGRVLPALVPVLVIDPELYEKALAVADARVAEANARIGALPTEEDNLKAQRTLHEESVRLANERLASLEALRAKGDASDDAVNAQRLALQAQKIALLQVNNALDSLPTRRNELAAVLAVAAAERERASLERDRTRVVAPFADGVVVEVFAREREWVAPGAPLFRIAHGELMDVEVKLPGASRGAVKAANRATVRERPEGRVLAQSRVQRLSPGVDPSSRVYTAWVQIAANEAPPGRPLVAGELLFVEVEGARHESVFALPREAEVENAFYVAREGVARRVEARIIARAGEMTLVAADGALREGDEVILSSLDIILDGTPVRPWLDDVSASERPTAGAQGGER